MQIFSENNYVLYFLGSRLKLNFHWKVHTFILVPSSFRSTVDVCTTCTVENRKVSTSYNLELETFKLISDKYKPKLNRSIYK